jgi:hypothetical protein
LGVFSQLERTRLVKKLKAARDRKAKETTGKCGGRKSFAEIKGGPELIALAKRLRRASPKTGRLSLRDIAQELAKRGYVNEQGWPYNPASIKSMVAGPDRD